MTVYTSAAIHKGISQLDLRRIVVQTGGSVEDIRRTGEYRIKYESMGKPSPPANSRIKGVNKRIVNYVRHALRNMKPEEPMKTTIEMNVNEDTFASTLKRLREARGWNRLDLSKEVSASFDEVSSWESGEAWPNGDQLARLFEKIPQLREFAQLHVVAEEPAATREPVVAKSLNQAIREAREFEKISLADAARLVEVSDNTFKSWEKGFRFGKNSYPSRPNAENYDRLCELFPQLRSFPKPDDLNTIRFVKKRTKKKQAKVRSKNTGDSKPEFNKQTSADAELKVAASVAVESPVAPVVKPPVVAAPVVTPEPKVEAPVQASIDTVEALSLAYGKALVAVVDAEKMVAVRKAEAEAALEALRRGAYGTPGMSA